MQPLGADEGLGEVGSARVDVAQLLPPIRVVDGPGVKDGGVDDGESAGDHGRAQLRIPYALECGFVPEHNDTVAVGERVEWKPTESWGSCRQHAPFECGSASNPKRFPLAHDRRPP